MVFEKLVQILVFGCAHDERIADGCCSATTLRRRRDEWIEAGVMTALRELALEAYDKIVGLQLSDVAVDCCLRLLPQTAASPRLPVAVRRQIPGRPGQTGDHAARERHAVRGVVHAGDLADDSLVQTSS
jgi:hypothetical protein